MIGAMMIASVLSAPSANGQDKMVQVRFKPDAISATY
jgi:hypothetical protein